jgi:hypothetical protein
VGDQRRVGAALAAQVIITEVYGDIFVQVPLPAPFMSNRHPASLVPLLASLVCIFQLTSKESCADFAIGVPCVLQAVRTNRYNNARNPATRRACHSCAASCRGTEIDSYVSAFLVLAILLRPSTFHHHLPHIPCASSS